MHGLPLECRSGKSSAAIPRPAQARRDRGQRCLSDVERPFIATAFCRPWRPPWAAIVVRSDSGSDDAARARKGEAGVCLARKGSCSGIAERERMIAAPDRKCVIEEGGDILRGDGPVGHAAALRSPPLLGPSAPASRARASR